MKKSLYSLILMDDVVHEIDLLAQSKDTNRSSLINGILADYVSLVTPEKKIDGIFDYLISFLGGGIFDACAEPRERTMSVKSYLDYKYRPTIKYEVEFCAEGDTAGELKIIFRTRSPELLYALRDFFNLWVSLERLYLRGYYPAGEIKYAFENGKFRRSFSAPRGKYYSDEETARAISDYIRMFDDLIKGYVGKNYDSRDMENRYVYYLENSIII